MTDPVRIPGLLDVTIEPPFVRSAQLEDLARHVIASFPEFEPIQTAQSEAGLRIEYVFETRPFDPAKDEYKPHTVAKVTKASALWLSLADCHLVIQFRRWFWERFDDEQRRAVLHHELTHVVVDEPDDQGRIPLSLRPHDVEEFAETMRRFGTVLPGRSRLVTAFKMWERENPDRAPRLPPPADSKPFADQVMDAMVGALERASDPDATDPAAVAARRALELKGGTDVSVTVRGRTFTAGGREVDPETGEILDVDNEAWVASPEGQAALEAHNARMARVRRTSQPGAEA